jgi:hypothetical protein
MRYQFQQTPKFWLILTIFLLLSVGVKAQVGMGVSGGMNLNQLKSPGLHMGLNSGVFITMDFSFLNLRTGISYNQLGGGREYYTHTPEFGNIESQTYINRQLVFHNMEIPTYLNFTMSGLKYASVKPRISIGFAYGYNISAIERYDMRFMFKDGLYAQVNNRTENIRGDMVPHHFDALGGFGLDFKLDNDRKAFVEIIYRHGLNQQNNVGLGRIGNIGDIYTNTVMFNLGITIF